MVDAGEVCSVGVVNDAESPVVLLSFVWLLSLQAVNRDNTAATRNGFDETEVIALVLVVKK